MADNVKIKIRRSTLNLTNDTLKNTEIDFGEPVFVDSSGGQYLIVGKNPTSPATTTTIANNNVVRLVAKNTADHIVYNDNSQLKDLSGNTINPVSTATSINYDNNNTVKDVLDNKVDISGAYKPLALGYDGTDVYVEV